MNLAIDYARTGKLPTAPQWAHREFDHYEFHFATHPEKLKTYGSVLRRAKIILHKIRQGETFEEPDF